MSPTRVPVRGEAAPSCVTLLQCESTVTASWCRLRAGRASSALRGGSDGSKGARCAPSTASARSAVFGTRIQGGPAELLALLCSVYIIRLIFVKKCHLKSCICVFLTALVMLVTLTFCKFLFLFLEVCNILLRKYSLICNFSS